MTRVPVCIDFHGAADERIDGTSHDVFRGDRLGIELMANCRFAA